MVSTAKDTGVSPTSFTEFDFVIVGGGLSGLVLAARLSEDLNVSVGVLEAGLWRPNDPKITTPYRMLEMAGSPEYQLVTNTVPQKHVGGRQLPLARGRVLGGGSTVNFLVWHRGSKQDYDSFEALGNPGWNFETIAKAGRKSETFHPPDTEEQIAVAATDASFHGKYGPVQTSFSGWIPQTQKASYDVMEKFGLAKNTGWHNGTNTGIRSSTSSVDPRTGTRSSSVTSYYEPNASRSNLSVLCGATATRVELERRGDLQVATGVHFEAQGKIHFVRARKEVIISAGALESPHLLELSGIGNSSILTSLGIDVKVNNPNVGENLQICGNSWVTYLTKPGDHTQDGLADPGFAAEAAAAYAAPSKNQNHGPLGGTVDALLYLPIKDYVSKSELGEMERKLREDTMSLAGNEGIKIIWTIRIAVRWSGFTFRASFLRRPPQSQGGRISASWSRFNIPSRVGIQIPPATDPHYLENSWDKAILVHGLEQIDKAARTEPLASLLDGRADPAPGDLSRGNYKKHLVDTIAAGIHWVGTVSMLPEDKGGVVDPRCRVYGTKNLCVIDASIIPLEISAHLQATVYAVAERAAELIIEDHKGA